MSVALLESVPKSRLKALLDHFGQIEDPREPWRVAHPLPEVLLLVVCGTICDCEDYDLIAEWGEEHLAVLRRYLPYHHGVPGGGWLTPGAGSRRGLAHPVDEPHQSGPVRGRLHGLGAGVLAGPPRVRGHRRQDLAAQPRSRDRHAAAASGLGLRDDSPPGARPGSRARQGE